MSTKRKTKLRKNNYTKKQKMRIAEQVYNITDKEVEQDYANLVEIGCQYHKAMSEQIYSSGTFEYTWVSKH